MANKTIRSSISNSPLQIKWYLQNTNFLQTYLIIYADYLYAKPRQWRKIKIIFWLIRASQKSQSNKVLGIYVNMYCKNDCNMYISRIWPLANTYVIFTYLSTYVTQFTKSQLLQNQFNWANKTIKARSMVMSLYVNTVFPHIVSAETILVWIYKSKGHST